MCENPVAFSQCDIGCVCVLMFTLCKTISPLGQAAQSMLTPTHSYRHSCVLDVCAHAFYVCTEAEGHSLLLSLAHTRTHTSHCDHLLQPPATWEKVNHNNIHNCLSSCALSGEMCPCEKVFILIERFCFFFSRTTGGGGGDKVGCGCALPSHNIDLREQ